MKIIAAIFILAISAAAESKWMLEINSSTCNAAKEAEEATLEFPENDDRAAPVAGISFKPSGFSSTERVSEVKPVEATPIETRAATKVARPDIWNL